MRRERAFLPILVVILALGPILFAACGRSGSKAADSSLPAGPAAGTGPSGAQTADRDLLGDLQLARSEDPSFDSVASALPALQKPREAVGVRHHPHEIGVAPDASLQISDEVDITGNPIAWFEVGDPPVRFGAAPGGCRKSLVDGAPVVSAVFEHQGVVYRQAVFGWSEGLSPEAPLWACVGIEAERRAGPAAGKARVSLHIGPGNAAKEVRSWDLGDGSGEASALAVKIPFEAPDRGWAEIGRAEYDAKKREVLRFWKDYLGAGATLRTPEARIDAARRAWLAYASLDIDQRPDGVLEPHDGAGFYEEVYGYSAALHAHALDLWGRPDEARAVLDSLLTFLAPDGVFTQHFGTPDTGTLLFAMGEHFALTADTDWLRRVAPNMIRMAGWIAAKRRESMTAAGRQRTATYGLIKFRPYCDFPQETYDYFGDAYCAAGLERTARALASIGLDAEARRIAAEAAAYRDDILASMDKAVFERGGLKVLPLEPETRRILDDSKGRASDYYSLIASCVLESEFLPATDERAGWIMRFIEERGGLRMGLCEFGGGIDHAYTYGYWLDCLKLDRVKPVILGLYGSLAYGMSRETYAGVEVTRLFSGDNEPTLPHLYSCTQQLRLLRMMLVQEDGDRLWLGRAMPRPWLGGESAVELRDAPTAFGPVSFTIRPRPAEGRTVVELAAPARRRPAAILLRLRDPKMRRMAAVTVNGRAIRTFDAETIKLVAPAGRLAIEVIYD
jgi:hypothetical protein